MSFKRLLSASVVVALLIAVYAVSGVYASDYQLRQEILPVPCESTPEAPPCPMNPPTVGAVSSNKGRPFLTGLYDANKSVRLLIEIAGVVYELGKNPELTVLNGVWTLDLTELVIPLLSGHYEIWVTTIDAQGAESRGQGQLIVTHVDEAKEPSVVEKGNLPSTGQAILWVVVGALSLILLAVLLIFGSKKKNRD